METFQRIIFTIFALGLLGVDFLAYGFMPKKTAKQCEKAFLGFVGLYFTTVVIVFIGYIVFLA